jgi:peptidoglycan/xylan/chitin deacetylase (PgdA/CDA1 family)
MFHRVSSYDASGILYNEHLKVSPEQLESLIHQALAMRFTFISLNELQNAVRRRICLPQRFLSITFDDGYRDNLELAYPILKRHSIPFHIYVTNSFPNKVSTFWWYALEQLILQNESLVLDHKLVPNHTQPHKNVNFLNLRRKIIKEHFRQPLEFLSALGSLEFDLQKEQEILALTWEHLRTLVKDPLVTIGCHTVNHYPLSKLSSEEAYIEILNSRNELQHHLDCEVHHFAFPFGSSNEVSVRDIRIAQSIGFQTITTTKPGHIYRDSDLGHLPRIFVRPFSGNNWLPQLLYRNLKSFYHSVARQLNRILP